MYVCTHKKRLELIFFFSVQLFIDHTDILYMYIHRHGVSKTSGIESFATSVHTNGTKPTSQPAHPPTSKWVQHLLFWKTFGRCLEKYLQYGLPAHCSFSSHCGPSVLKTSLQKAFERHSRACRSAVPRACAERDVTAFISRSFIVHRGGETWPWCTLPLPVFNEAFIYPRTVLRSSFLAQRNPNLPCEIPFLSVPYRVYQIFHSAYQISYFYNHLTQRVTTAESSTTIIFNDN